MITRQNQSAKTSTSSTERPHECPSREAGSCLGARSCPAALNQTDVLVLLLTFIGLVTLIKSSDLSRGIFILLR